MNFKRCVFSGVMYFASGSIFGNKFLTPEGIKTLFPIFENTLCGKVLAVKTLALFKRERWTFGFFNKLCFQFETVFSNDVGMKPFSSSIAWQYLGLRVWWVGNSLFVSCLVANSHPSFSRPFCNNTIFICHALCPVAGRERTDPNCICVGKKRSLLGSFRCRFSNLFSVRRANF